jgi:hypothetical protein
MLLYDEDIDADGMDRTAGTVMYVMYLRSD